MHFSKTFFLSVALLVATVHCSGSNDDSVPASNATPTDPNGGNNENSSGGADAAASNDSEAPKPDGGSSGNNPNPSTCNSIVNDATAITYVDIAAQSAPAPTGGAMPDGTYHLKSITLYAGPNGKAGKIPLSLKNTVKVKGNAVDQVLDGTKNGGNGNEVIAERTSETFTTSGSTVTYTMTCPETKSRSGAYSVSGNTMTLFLKNDLGQTAGYVYAP